MVAAAGAAAAAAAVESLDLWYVGAAELVLTLVLVLVEEEREKEKLAFVDTVRWDFWDIPDSDRCRTRVLYFFGWDGARCGTTGVLDGEAGARVCCWLVVLKKADRWFGSGDNVLFPGDDSTSGLVGGVLPLVSALSDMSSSDLCDEPAEEADMGWWISGALYDSMFVV